MMFRKVSSLQRSVALMLTAQLLFAAGPLSGIEKEKKIGGGLNFFSPKDETAMGRKYSDELNSKLNLVHDPTVISYVRDLGSRLVEQSLRRDLQYQFFVVNTREVNAFALPGGFIYVNRGLIDAASSDSELAGVLGHEIGHVVGRHSLKQMSKQLLFFGIVAGAGALISLKSEKWSEVTAALGGIGVFFAGLKYSRDDEREADRLGLYEMTQAGYDPTGMVGFFQKLDRMSKEKGGGGPAFFSTHPLPAERVRNMQAEIEKLKPAPAGRARGDLSLQACKAHLTAIPLPPPSKDKSLGEALVSLDDNSGDEMVAISGRQGRTRSLTVPGNTVWLDTGIDVVEGQPVEISASGSVHWKKNSDDSCDPWGVPGTDKGFWKPLPKTNTAALVGRIGSEAKTTFAVGAHRIIKAPAAGRLFLGINDDNNFDNRGSFEAHLTIYR